MEPEEFSRAVGKILGSGPATMDERDAINNAMGQADSIEEMPEDIQRLLAEIPARANRYYAPESRASRVSKMEREIIKDSDKCPQCVANNDPRKVPVHPNCHCDVVTRSVETGVADPGSPLLGVINTIDGLMEIEVVNGEVPTAIQMNGETVAIFDADDVRFADLARWLEQMGPYLEATDQYVSIVVDDDTEEAIAQVSETLEIIAQDPELLAEAIRNKKLWFGIAQAVI